MNLSSFVIPVLLAAVAVFGMGKRVDVYAVCKLVLFCVDKDLVKAKNIGAFQSYPQLWDNEPVCRLYTAIFRNDPTLRSIPTLAKLREALEDAANHCH